MSLRKLFLPVGLLLAMLLGLVLPAPGAWLYDLEFEAAGPLTPRTACIVGIFLIVGYQLDVIYLRWGRAFAKTLLMAVCVNLLLAPLVAAGVVTAMGLGSGAALGLYVTACVPTTLSSSAVITRAAGGNEAWAVSLIVLLNTLGVFFLAFTLTWCLGTAGIEIREAELLLKILLLVIVPLVMGQAVRLGVGHRPATLLDYLPSALVILMAWMAISSSHARIWGLSAMRLISLVSASILLHALLLAAAYGAGRVLRLTTADLKALVFVAAQKTLPIAMAVLSLLADQDAALEPLIGTAAVVCVLHHFLQINGDSVIAAVVGPREAGANGD